MMIILFISFLIFYFFAPLKDQIIFKKSGWLYFLSHYQLFMFGIFSLFFSLASLIYGLFYAFFFYNANFFIISFFIFAALFPFALDSISYALFGGSFFLERFLFKGKNLTNPTISSFYSFLNIYVRFLYFFLSFLFFFLFYFFFFCFYSFLFWSLINQRNLCFDLFLFFIDYWFLVPFSILFFIPVMLELFSYGIRKTSFFRHYSDF